MRSRTLWLAVCAWWTVSGLASTGALASMGNVPWQSALLASMASSLLWIPFTLALAALVRRLPLSRRRLAAASAAYLGAAAAICLVRALLVLALNPLVGWYAELPPFGQLLLTSVWNNFLLALLVAGVLHAWVFAERARERERRAIQAELSALNARLRPHFLFNTLGSIAELIHQDPDAADRLIVALAGLLRRSLERADADEVSLDEELRFVRQYVAIEETRLRGRLAVAWDVDPAARAARLPHLLLQPLVENAVLHGVAPRAAGGRITIGAHRADRELVVSVEDDGAGLSAPRGEGRGGLGLASTRARLAALYGPEQSLELSTPPGGGTRVVVRLPFRPAEVPS
jgi:two-component system, LytTR family, sensor kinase